MLAIEVEYLSGVAYAADDGGDAQDWPPQPDRLFSALVASWGARGEQKPEREALEWLEGQPAPQILASRSESRSVVGVFVPPNDDTSKAVTILPSRRRRQERRFPASVPHTPLVVFSWPANPEAGILDALDALARDTSYLGHSASLVRCRASTVEGLGRGFPSRRGIYPGRLAELERIFRAGERSQPGQAFAPPEPIKAAPPASVFGTDWIVFSPADAMAPDQVATVFVAKTLLKTVQAGYGEGQAPEWVSGHAEDGSPSAAPHLATVPLLDAGWDWSQGRLMGMALILPRTMEDGSRRARDPSAPAVSVDDASAAEEENRLYRALGKRSVAGRGNLKLALKLPGGSVFTVVREPTPSAASLKSRRYTKPSCRWATVTPIALDRHPKAKGDVEATIAEACVRIGLPTPLTVVAGKHSAVRGAASAIRSRGAPAWCDWRLPGSLAGRRLIHAVITFAAPVAGPVILGAGRFVGLGFCLGVDEEGRP